VHVNMTFVSFTLNKGEANIIFGVNILSTVDLHIDSCTYSVDQVIVFYPKTVIDVVLFIIKK